MLGILSGSNEVLTADENGGSDAKLGFVGVSFLSYVNGYEEEILSTTFVDVDKVKMIDDNNNKTRFNVKNFVNVTMFWVVRCKFRIR